MRKTLIAGIGAVAALVLAPMAHAEVGDQADAEQAVRTIYNQVQRGCTPTEPPQFQSISWDFFNADSGGQGRIHDAHPGLGGPFVASFWNPRVGPAQDGPAGRAYGQWSVKLEFC